MLTVKVVRCRIFANSATDFVAAIVAGVVIALGANAEQKCKRYTDGCAKVAHHFDGRDQ
jgi:hypothetical protein